MKTIKYLFLQYVCWYFMYRASGIIHHRHLMRLSIHPLDNISIAQLKQRYTNITTPQLIEDNLVIKGIVTGMMSPEIFTNRFLYRMLQEVFIWE